jgi:hypothetical protein
MGVNTDKEEHKSGGFTPSPDFSGNANINDHDIYQKAARDLVGFWD